MKDIIDHVGIVENIDGGHVRVRIVQSSACSTCHAKSLCVSAESKEKLIDVYNADTDELKVGDNVRVCASVKMGRNAVLIAFVAPLVLMVAWLVSAIKLLAFDELLAMAGLLVLLTLYYIGVWLMRRRLSKEFSFWIEREM